MVKKISVANGALEVSQISLGCMRIADLSAKEADTHVHSALELGIDFLTTPTSTQLAKPRKYSQVYWRTIRVCVIK